MNLFELFAVIGLKDDGFAKGINDATGKTDGLTKKTKGLIETVAEIKVVSSAFQMIGNSIGAAVERYDTLNRFPRVLQSMGFEASATESAMSKLTAGIQGLPTRLDDIVATAQNLTVLTGNLEQATDISLALNNAFLASGASSADAARGMTQYTQQLSKGTVDMMSWRTLQETMGYALRETAEAMGFAGTAATTDLYKALQSGTVTFDQFNKKIIELNKGTGGFAEMAKTSSAGIGTSFANMKTAVVRGITAIITALDKNRNIQISIESIGKGFENALKSIGGFTSIITTILTPALWLLANGMGAVLSVLGPLTVAFVTYRAALVITSMVQALSVGFTVLESAMLAVPTIMNLVTAAQTALNVAMTANPVGLVIAGVAALVTGLIALYNWLSGTKKSTDELTDSMDKNATATGKNATATNDLIKSSDDLSQSYGKTTKSVKELSDTIYDSFEEAKKAADEYNKQFTNQGYMLIKNAEGRAQTIRKSEYQLYENLKEYIDKYYQGASESQKVAIAKSIYANRDMLEQIKKDYYGIAPSAGAAVADGLAKGMLDNRGVVQSAARVLAGDVEKEMNKVLERRSPSRVTGRIGKDVVLGFVNAISAGRKSVQRAVTSISDVVKDNLATDEYGVGFSGGSGGGSEEIIVEATTDTDSGRSGASVYHDYRVMNLNVNGIEEMNALVDWWNNKRINERAAGTV